MNFKAKNVIKDNDKVVDSIRRYNNCKNKSTKYIKQILIHLKREIDSNTIIVGDFSAPCLWIDYPDKKSINISLKWHIRTERLYIHIERFLPKAAKHTFF